jgi:DNA/RNA endonuclease G (NUC1)
MVPQDANINRKDYRNFENELAKEVHAGKKVYVKVEPIYEGDSKRPVTIMVTYSIDEKESVRLFPNGQEG